MLCIGRCGWLFLVILVIKICVFVCGFVGFGIVGVVISGCGFVLI